MIYHVQESTLMSMNFNTELVTIFYPCTLRWQGSGIEITSVKDKNHTHTHTLRDNRISIHCSSVSRLCLI
jgi:hypothetical protein